MGISPGSTGSIPRDAGEEQERLLGRIADTSPDYIAAVDRELRLIAGNRAFFEEFPRVFGVEPGIGLAPADVLAHQPGELARLEALLRHALAGASGVMVGAFGDPRLPERLFEVRYQPLRDEGGAVTGAALSAREVTADVAARREVDRLTQELEARVQERTRELLDSEKRRRLAMTVAGVGDWELDPRTQSMYWSLRTRELLGVALDAPARLSLLRDRIHPDDRGALLAAIRTAAGADGPGLCQVEFRVVHPDGRTCWLEANGRAEFVEGPEGRQAVAMRGVLLDVTERRRAERERAYMDQVLERTSDAFWAVDAQWRFTYVNQRAETLWGRPRRSLIGQCILDVFPELAGSESYERAAHAMHAREPVHYETESPVLHSWIAVSAYPAVDGGIFVFFRDISERKAAEREREALLAREHAARMEAQQASSAKSEFLAVMSHELRTPLNAIAGYAELLEMGIHGPVTEAQLDALRRIQRAERHLLGLVDEVMNLARIERQAMHYVLDEVPAAELLTAAEAMIAPQMRARTLTLTTRPPDPSLRVHADDEKLRQVLLNLLGNAVKFTEPGGRVDVWCEASESTVAIHVRDTGRGIPPAKLELVFEPFMQVDARLTRNEEGMGLGLAISRELARGMGGEVSVVSEVGVGSTFTVSVRRVAS